VITRLAAAKVNLDLRITGRRVDGYHELDSLIAFASVGDVLTFEPASSLTLVLDGPFAGGLNHDAPQDNLVLRAAGMLQQRYDIGQGARISLTKHLPVAAGLGGGSADAAATLRGLAALWGIAAADAELAALGLALGADVPVCLSGTPCRLTGIGERIEPLGAFPALWLVLVNPGVGLSTASVFKAFDGLFSTPRSRLKCDDRTVSMLIEGLAGSHNDLEAPAVGLVPQIAGCLRELRASGECLLARMSGSGASCFGLFPSPESATRSAASIRAAQPGWWVADGHIGAADNAAIS
jgi:4-diphosphocytidyl-2-C-methyl-D-erythritol kinase